MTARRTIPATIATHAAEIRGKPIVAAMTGVGIVNATHAANASFADLTCSRHGLRIARIVFSGTAGGLPPAGIGDVAVPATCRPRSLIRRHSWLGVSPPCGRSRRRWANRRYADPRVR
ncbi:MULTISPECIES: 5'-methylthioadenosine/S-adenosylhomocysteine nucleosidase [Gordonia]|uniref:5'-methylthioadenosine/S-adenosylhomocysteine nucleosidase n=1 Tax=Gordonia TaxID=2053 RepID=UPI001443FA28|nr:MULTISPECIES: 5'-methylthioadenosine/S-adenosylhomocysteine nucleosidase [Gordonia]NKY93622.1 5'-methylthioadenosine/S-adenosylhomocysteine nucleosidase [Gordonia sputi]